MQYLQEMREDLKTHTDKQLKALEIEIEKSVESCHEKITELVAKVNTQSESLKEYEKMFETIRMENFALLTKMKVLEQQHDNADQYSRINCLEINNIPEVSNENVVEIIKNIGRSLDVAVKEEDTDACYRLGPKQEGRRREIIVKFVRRNTKEEMLWKRKIRRNLSTSDIGIQVVPQTSFT